MIRLFDYNRPLGSRLAEGHQRITAAVDAEDEDYIRSVDAKAWAEHLASKEQIDPPTILATAPVVEDLGEAQVDATGMPGVTFSSSEWGRPLIRPGRRVKLTVPFSGQARLLAHAPTGGAAIVDVDHLQDNGVEHIWEWPIERGTQVLEQEVNELFGRVRDGAGRVAAEVEEYNRGLVAYAVQAIAARKSAVDRQKSFLDSMTMPVAPRSDAPERLEMPPVRERPSPAKEVVPKPEPPTGPTLGRLYDDILSKARTLGVTMERSPSVYAPMGEEDLRSHLLTILNSHYEGHAFAEAFNASGKTDILIRVGDKNIFIAECKWWGGPTAMSQALDQLLGYTT